MQTIAITAHNQSAWRVANVLHTLRGVRGLLVLLQPIALLFARLYVALIFFLSGLIKIRDWSSTVALFTDEYHVPILSPQIAAAMAAGGELALRVLLARAVGAGQTLNRQHVVEALFGRLNVAKPLG